MATPLRDLIRAFKNFGGDVEKPGHGSHWKFTKNGKTYPIPAHNGKKSKVGDRYVKALCQTFGIDLDEFKRYL